MSHSRIRCRLRRTTLSLAGALAFAATTAHAAEVVLVTSAASGIPALTAEEASQLYLGRRTTLSDGTAVTLYDLPGGPTRDRFYELLTGKNPNQIRAYWSRQVFTGRALPPREAKSADDLPTLLSNDGAAIGYLPDGQINPRLRVLLKLP